jgi:LCP family protein required for cell wall assembly
MFIRQKDSAIIKLPATGSPKAGKKGFWKRKSTKITILVVGLLLVIALAAVLTVYSQFSRIFATNFSGGSQILKLLTGNNDVLKGQSDGRINIAIMGYGGAGHDGAYLTDTIQVLSIDTKNNKLAMLSIPRDLYVEMKSPYYSGKINGVYPLGKPASPKSSYDGATLTENELSTILNIPIDYYASLDFSGFKKAIDNVGGIDVTVDRTFTDYEYPADTGDGYLKPQTFKAGLQHMDGTRALIFARSRHSAGAEGSDFARSQRQQKVMVAFKDQLMSQGLLSNPAKFLSMVDILSSSLKTDMQPTEIKALATLIKGLDTSNIISKTLDDSATGLLADFTGSDGAYLLRPKAGINNWTAIQQLANNIFNSQSIPDKSAKIDILNGSSTAGLALNLSTTLKGDGYNIVRVDKTTLTATTVIYDYSSGNQKDTLDFLKSQLSANVISRAKTSAITSDIVIVVGNNYQENSVNLQESTRKQSNS